MMAAIRSYRSVTLQSSGRIVRSEVNMLLTLFLLLQLNGLIQVRTTAQVVPINPDAPLTVCQILADLPRYQSKIVQVRGKWLGTSLDGHDCQPLRTGEYVWEMGIAIAEPDSPILELEGERVTWTLDRRAVDRAAQQMETQRNRYGRYVMGTFIGRLDTREEGLATYRTDDGKLHGLGFGHLNRYPARLVIATVKDIVPVK